MPVQLLNLGFPFIKFKAFQAVQNCGNETCVTVALPQTQFHGNNITLLQKEMSLPKNQKM